MIIGNGEKGQHQIGIHVVPLFVFLDIYEEETIQWYWIICTKNLVTRDMNFYIIQKTDKHASDKHTKIKKNVQNNNNVKKKNQQIFFPWLPQGQIEMT